MVPEKSAAQFQARDLLVNMDRCQSMSALVQVRGDEVEHHGVDAAANRLMSAMGRNDSLKQRMLHALRGLLARSCR
jgi:hypothetical protein